jgi:hypothetical protein
MLNDKHHCNSGVGPRVIVRRGRLWALRTALLGVAGSTCGLLSSIGVRLSSNPELNTVIKYVSGWSLVLAGVTIAVASILQRNAPAMYTAGGSLYINSFRVWPRCASYDPTDSIVLDIRNLQGRVFIVKVSRSEGDRGTYLIVFPSQFAIGSPADLPVIVSQWRHSALES